MLVVTVIVGGALVLAGVRSVVPPLAAGVAALVLFGATCVRRLTAAVAVAVFGMGLGCAALVTVLGVTSGFEHALTSKLARVNGHVLLTEYGQDFNEYPQVVAAAAEDPRVAAASPFALAMAAVVPVRGDDEASEQPSRAPAIALVKAVDPNLAANMPGVPEMLRGGDLKAALRPGSWDATPGVALGYKLATRLGVKIGDRVNLVIPAELDGTAASLGRPPRHASFEVRGLVDTGVTEFDTQLALCHLSAGQALFFGEARATGMEFWLHDPEDADAVAEGLMAGLGRDFRATTWREQSEGTVAGLRQIRGAVSLVLGLLEVVAATALVASLLLLVRRKRAEIAALMALGADGRAVFWIFEVVGLLAGLAGAAIGVGLGLLLSGLVAAYRYPLSGDVYPVDHLPVRLTADDMLFPGVAALLLCALVSGPVALVAAKQPLLAGLRRT